MITAEINNLTTNHISVLLILMKINIYYYYLV
ncbi:hypothetical protein ABID31_001003 [Chryseobacterium flavum]